MKDTKEIRRQLWHSLDMAYVKQRLFVAAVCAPITWLILRLSTRGYHAEEQAPLIWISIAIILGPILIFCIILTFNIFRHPES